MQNPYMTLPQFINEAWLETVRVFGNQIVDKENLFKEIFLSVVRQEFEKESLKISLAKAGTLEKEIVRTDIKNQMFASEYNDIYKNMKDVVITYSRTAHIVSKCIREALIATGISNDGTVPELIDNGWTIVETYPTKMISIPYEANFDELLEEQLGKQM